MNYMVRVLKVAVSNGFVNDIVTVYKAKSLQDVTPNKTDFFINVASSDYESVEAARNELTKSVVDVSDNPDRPFVIVRQHKYSVNLTPELLATAYENGHLVMTETTFNSMLVSHS